MKCTYLEYTTLFYVVLIDMLIWLQHPLLYTHSTHWAHQQILGYESTCARTKHVSEFEACVNLNINTEHLGLLLVSSKGKGVLLHWIPYALKEVQSGYMYKGDLDLLCYHLMKTDAVYQAKQSRSPFPSLKTETDRHTFFCLHIIIFLFYFDSGQCQRRATTACHIVIF